MQIGRRYTNQSYVAMNAISRIYHKAGRNKERDVRSMENIIVDIIAGKR